MDSQPVRLGTDQRRDVGLRTRDVVADVPGPDGEYAGADPRVTDRSDASDSICVLADPALAGAATWLQTLASIVLDLDAREFKVTDGPSCLSPFRSLRL